MLACETARDYNSYEHHSIFDRDASLLAGYMYFQFLWVININVTFKSCSLS